MKKTEMKLSSPGRSWFTHAV